MSAALPVGRMSSVYAVKRLSERDIPDILALCRGNRTYYRHLKTEPTPENLREVFTALPPGVKPADKYFLGFYRDNRLSAVLDLVTGYPDADTAFIGWLMLDADFQGVGAGSAIVAELAALLKAEGFHAIRLGCIKGYEQAQHFWRKNGFLPMGEEAQTRQYTVVLMQRKL